MNAVKLCSPVAGLVVQPAGRRSAEPTRTVIRRALGRMSKNVWSTAMAGTRLRRSGFAASGDARFAERRHAGVTGDGGAQQRYGENRARRFAEAHVESSSGRFVQPSQQTAVPRLGRKMPDLAVIEGVGPQCRQRGGGGTGDEAIEDHRHPAQTGRRAPPRRSPPFPIRPAGAADRVDRSPRRGGGRPRRRRRPPF